MTKPATTPKKRKQPWFAPRQVYVRTGQGSSYVELSTMLQVCVAIGFGLIALWLLGASYSAARHAMDNGSNASLLAELETSQEKLVEITSEASKVPALEAALTDAKASIAEAQQLDETAAISAELGQTQSQLEEIRMQLSKSKSEEATLQAKLEALAAEGKTFNSQAAEEAASLHAQLEDAFIEIENLEKERDEADAKAAALTAENTEKDNNAERNQTLLSAATEEIERLQTSIASETSNRDDREAELGQEVDRLTSLLDEEKSALSEEKSARETLQQRADSLSAEIERQSGELEHQSAELERQSAELDHRSAEFERQSAELERQSVEFERQSAELERQSEDAANLAEDKELEVAAAAERHVDAIAADLKEAELLATIDDLRSQVGSQNAVEAQNESENSPDTNESPDVKELKGKLALAEAEIEMLLKNMLSSANNQRDENAGKDGDSERDQSLLKAATDEIERLQTSIINDEDKVAAAVPDTEEVDRLETDLSTAKSEIIKLKSDVRAAKKRLAEKTETKVITESKPGNTAKLQQQLASTRSRMQQLNKALADAKLREVAIDLALISVVPSPSPPAPR